MWASDVGTHRGHIGSRTPEARQRNAPVYRYFSNAGGGTRTPDTRIMIPRVRNRQSPVDTGDSGSGGGGWTQIWTHLSAGLHGVALLTILAVGRDR